MVDGTPTRARSLWLRILIALVAIAGLLGLAYLSQPRFEAWSGWTARAARFPAPRDQAFARLWFRSVRIDGRQYAASTVLSASPQGLYLNYHLLFVEGRQPVFIPWKKLRARWQIEGLFFWLKLTTKDNPKLTLELQPEEVEALEKLAQGAFRAPSRY